MIFSGALLSQGWFVFSGNLKEELKNPRIRQNHTGSNGFSVSGIPEEISRSSQERSVEFWRGSISRYYVRFRCWIFGMRCLQKLGLLKLLGIVGKYYLLT